jgi:hypothetical protein
MSILLKNCTRFTRASGPANSTAEKKNNVRLFYIQGFNFLKIAKIKELLFAARFHLSKIKSIQWIGRTVLEVVVDDQYSSLFKKHIEDTHVLCILPKFDARKHNKVLTPEAQAMAEERFASRIGKILASEADQTIKNFYSDYVSESGGRIKQAVAKFLSSTIGDSLSTPRATKIDANALSNAAAESESSLFDFHYTNSGTGIIESVNIELE